MNLVDLWAAAAAGAACAALLLRGNMLKPDHAAWASAPWPVWVTVIVTAIAFGCSAVSIGAGGHASPREAMIYTVIAVAALVMVLNLNRHGRLAEARRRQFAEEAQLAFENTPPPARYLGERRDG